MIALPAFGGGGTTTGIQAPKTCPPIVAQGVPYDCTINVTNLSDVSLVNVKVTDEWPLGTTPVEYPCMQGPPGFEVAVTTLGASGSATASCRATVTHTAPGDGCVEGDVFDVDNSFASGERSDTGGPTSGGASGAVLVPGQVCQNGCGFLVIDEDSIDNGNPPNFFSDVDVNDQLARIGLRAPLPVFANAAGQKGVTFDLWTGTVGDEGWFALKTIPENWDTAGPILGDGLQNFWLAGKGLGSGKNREKFLDKIRDVTPLRADGLNMLLGECICAVVYDSDISINYDPLNGSLKGANLGVVAFTVNTVTHLEGQSSGSLPVVNVTPLDPGEVCDFPLGLFTDAPVPISSSDPYDVIPD